MQKKPSGDTDNDNIVQVCQVLVCQVPNRCCDILILHGTRRAIRGPLCRFFCEFVMRPTRHKTQGAGDMTGF